MLCNRCCRKVTRVATHADECEARARRDGPDLSAFSIHRGVDGYVVLACVRCGHPDYGTTLLFLDDAHPVPDLVVSMVAHVGVCGSRDG